MFGGGLLPLVGLNILLGVLVPGIDNWAHLGGLIAGVAIALFLRPLADEITSPTWTTPRRVVTLVVIGLVVGSLVAAATFFIRFRGIFETDAQWMVRREIPGNLSVLVPGTWVEKLHSADHAAYRSICYDGWLEASALDAKSPQQAFLAELNRLGKGGFRLPGNDPLLVNSLVNDLYMRSRVQVRLAGIGRREREQVFILLEKTLVSVGVEIPENLAASFAPARERMLGPLPEPR